MFNMAVKDRNQIEDMIWVNIDKQGGVNPYKITEDEVASIAFGSSIT